MSAGVTDVVVGRHAWGFLVQSDRGFGDEHHLRGSEDDVADGVAGRDVDRDAPGFQVLVAGFERLDADGLVLPGLEGVSGIGGR